MAAFFANLRNTVIAGIVLAVIMFLIYLQMQGYDSNLFWRFLFRWLHVISGIMWIGLLWYFNFVSTPTMPNSMGIDSIVLMRLNMPAVFAAASFSGCARSG